MSGSEGRQHHLDLLQRHVEVAESPDAARYPAVWNEADARLRRRAVADLWADDGMEYVSTARRSPHVLG
ncbi:hypothetical protein AB4305_09135 [Nocardia sp. 2YAB30]|uniref:hypothetical protein n=1 Tax=unclassified Nocardia TaxID=2637762 RepID=UPI003F9CAF06